MYNQEIKQGFIKSRAKTVAEEHNLLGFFSKTEPFEQSVGHDLGVFSREELQECFNSFADFQRGTVLLQRSYYKAYVRYLRKHKLPAKDVSEEIELVFDDICSRLVGSPEHLENELDLRYLPAENGSVDFVFRAYFWLAYSGVREDDLPILTADNLNLREMMVSIGNRSYELYDQAVLCLRYCAEMQSFNVYSEARGTSYVRIMPRVNGNQLLRGTRGLVCDRAWRHRLSVYHPIKERAQLPMLLYRYVWRSGIFYRMYQREQIGIPVDFADTADLFFEGKQYEQRPYPLTMGQRKQRLCKRLSEEYMSWKSRFAL